MKKVHFLLILCCLLFFPLSVRTEMQIDIIPWEELPPVQEGQTHILLLCLDCWHADFSGSGNTDGIVLVTLDNRARRVMLTSVIRDAMVLYPDNTPGRISRLCQEYSPKKLCRTLSQHLGVRIEQYILFDFQQVASMIDELGGVDIEVSAEEIRYLNRYAIPRSSTDRPLTIPGTYHFNGHSAVIYMRIRKAGGGGDLMRTQRVRNVLKSLAGHARGFTEEEAEHLANDILEHNTMTNMNLEAMLSAARQAYSLRDCTVEELRIPPDSLLNVSMEDEVFVQEIDWTACRKVFTEYLRNSILTQTALPAP